MRRVSPYTQDILWAEKNKEIERLKALIKRAADALEAAGDLLHEPNRFRYLNEELREAIK